MARGAEVLVGSRGVGRDVNAAVPSTCIWIYRSAMVSASPMIEASPMLSTRLSRITELLPVPSGFTTRGTVDDDDVARARRVEFRRGSCEISKRARGASGSTAPEVRGSRRRTQ
jgi:hypothetical protein